MSTFDTISNLSPLDGRYASKTEALRPIFSEYGLIKSRLAVEVAWFIELCQSDAFVELEAIDDDQIDALGAIVEDFDLEAAERVKDIERETNHDVKAVEYYLKQRLLDLGFSAEASEFIHFACTSEDINNTAYAIMIAQGQDELLNSYEGILKDLADKAAKWKDIPMLSRTHGQTASPTTVGKEIANVHHRLNRQIDQLDQQEVLAKFNGAVGNFNAHAIAYPEIDWNELSREFINNLELTHNPMTTQIEPHDYIAEIMHNLIRANTILIDLCRDMWTYISLGYFKQSTRKGEVGSSTMPHKVNPIDFENAEGNFGLANAIAEHLATKLPVSRMQRDLTDSTVLRNLGLAFGYTTIAVDALLKGLGKVSVNAAALEHDLATSWEVLAEAVQTVMRRHGIEAPYEQLKALTRGKDGIDRETIIDFIYELDLPEEAKARLLELTPQTYTGIAEELTDRALSDEF